MDLMVQKYKFGRERYIKEINDISEWQKEVAKSRRLVEKIIWKEVGVTAK